MSKIRNILVCGNFGNDVTPNGQTRKSKEIVRFLIESGYSVKNLDTSDRLKFFVCCWRLLFSRRLVVIPGVSAIRAIWPLVCLNRAIFSERSVRLCIAVGGWLPDLAGRAWYVRAFLRSLTCTLVQTGRMRDALEHLGYSSRLMRNFRHLNPLPTRRFTRSPIRLLFLSRVRVDKGILKAVQLHAFLNESGISSSLSVYGPIEPTEAEIITASLSTPGVSYNGILHGDARIMQVMGEHHLLVFPTTYAGEGEPGVLIEALFSGLPALCCDWIDLCEVVDQGSTGYLFPVETFVSDAFNIIATLDDKGLEALSRRCLLKTRLYRPEYAGRVLLEILSCAPGDC